MEAVLYEDFGSHNNFLNMNNINQLKRKLTLDLDMGSGDGNGPGKQLSVIKKAKVASLNTPGSAALLLSPDVSKLALPTPELERFIINSTSTLPTPTPNQNQIFFPRNVTEEQEAYAQGFTEALNKLHGYTTASPSNNNNTIIMTTANSNNISLSSNSLVNTSTAQALAVLNQDPQMHQLLPNMSMNNQKFVSMPPTSAPPPPAYHDYSSDTSDDTMSESSCSNSTNSSSYAPGHMVVPTSSMLNSANATIPIAVTSANHSMIPHRLPDYQINQMTFGGATGSSGNIAAIPVSAAGYPQTSSNSPIPVLIKEEPQIVPNMSSPNPVTPIDMETQEQIKLERKRQRNRLAASKCRKRKLERISKLEDKVKQLKGENGELSNVLTKLKDTVCSLKQQVMDHVNSGCQMMIPPNLTAGF